MLKELNILRTSAWLWRLERDRPSLKELTSNKKEYTSKFSLNSGVRLTSETHRNLLREKIKVQENLKDITEINKATRFKKGQVSPRKGKGASLQTCYNLTFPRPRKKKED